LYDIFWLEIWLHACYFIDLNNYNFTDYLTDQKNDFYHDFIAGLATTR